MSDNTRLVLVVLIPAVVSLVGVILGFLNKGKIHDLHLLVNSRLTELIEASIDKGRIAEQRDLANRQSAEDRKGLPKEQS